MILRAPQPSATLHAPSLPTDVGDPSTREHPRRGELHEADDPWGYHRARERRAAVQQRREKEGRP